MSMKIKSVFGREILDSRGNPTVEATVVLESGAIGVASVPSGASTGKHEATELRDLSDKRYGGRGVMGAVGNIVGLIAPAIVGISAEDQAAVDRTMIELDGTKSKGRLGANATLAVSLATARAAANGRGAELYEYLGGGREPRLPVPMLNILNGGAHASNNVEIQEFMILPVGAESLGEGVRWSVEIYQALKKLLGRLGYSTTVGDEGGFAPNLASDEEALELICQAVKNAGYSTDEVKLGIDVASSEWFDGGEYILKKRGERRSADELIGYYEGLLSAFPIISIEDGVGEDDFDGWKRLTKRLGDRIMLVGDDLFVTNEQRLGEGIGMGIGNTILIKPNQIGTLTETLGVIEMARSAGYKHIVSHRSGETEDTFIADLSVATAAPFIKTGAPARSERVAKYNRLMMIETLIGNKR